MAIFPIYSMFMLQFSEIILMSFNLLSSDFYHLILPNKFYYNLFKPYTEHMVDFRAKLFEMCRIHLGRFAIN